MLQNQNSRKLYRNMPLDIYNQFDTIKSFQQKKVVCLRRPNAVIQYSHFLVIPNLIPRNCMVCFNLLLQNKLFWESPRLLHIQIYSNGVSQWPRSSVLFVCWVTGLFWNCSRSIIDLMQGAHGEVFVIV